MTISWNVDEELPLRINLSLLLKFLFLMQLLKRYLQLHSFGSFELCRKEGIIIFFSLYDQLAEFLNLKILMTMIQSSIVIYAQ